MTIKKVSTNKAPAAIGPYSQAIQTGSMIFTSGQLPIDATTGAFPDNTIEAQARCSFNNVQFILEEAGYTLKDVVKTVIYLQNLSDFDVVNKIYAEYFSEPYPARSCFQVAALPKNALIEVEVIASK